MAETEKEQERERIAELFKQGCTMKEIQQMTGAPMYRISRIRNQLPDEVFRVKRAGGIHTHPEFWSDWEETRNLLLGTENDRSAEYMPRKFWREWEEARHALLKNKRRRTAG